MANKFNEYMVDTSVILDRAKLYAKVKLDEYPCMQQDLEVKYIVEDHAAEKLVYMLASAMKGDSITKYDIIQAKGFYQTYASWMDHLKSNLCQLRLIPAFIKRLLTVRFENNELSYPITVPVTIENCICPHSDIPWGDKESMHIRFLKPGMFHSGPVTVASSYWPMPDPLYNH